MANWGKRWQWQLQFENPLGVQLRKKVKRESYNIYNIYIIKYILHFLPTLHEAANFARGRLGISNCNCHCHRSFLKKGFQNKDANAYKSVRQRQWTGSCKNYELARAKLWVSKYKLPLIFIYQPFPPPNQQPFLHQNHQLPSAENPHFPLFCSISPLITPHYLVVPNKSCNFAAAIPEMPLWQRKQPSECIKTSKTRQFDRKRELIER